MEHVAEIFPGCGVKVFGPEYASVVEDALEDCTKGVRKVHLISAAKGMGKSKAIRKAVAGAGRVLNITFRRSLARSSSAEIPDCVVYMDHDDLDGHMQAGRPLTILINSILRLSPLTTCSPQIIILDEWVSILEMLGSDIINDEKRFLIIKRLHHFLQLARTIIVSDALLDRYSLVCLRSFLESDGGMAPHLSAIGPAFGLAYDLTLYDYQHKPHASHDFVHHAKLDSFLSQLVRSILTLNHKVVVPCMTKAFALRVYEIVKDWERKVLLYTSDSCADMLSSSLSKINETWGDCDILIYSPVITAGCSFEIRGHFDECFLYAYQGTASVRSALQMIFRVRDLARRKVHIHLEKGSMADFNQVHPLVINHRSPHAPHALIINDHIMHMAKVREFDRRFCFGSAFWDLVQRSGARVMGDPLQPSELATNLTARRQAREDLDRYPTHRKSRVHVGDLLEEGVVGTMSGLETFRHDSDAGFDAQASEFDPEKWHAHIYARGTAQAQVVDDSMDRLSARALSGTPTPTLAPAPAIVADNMSPRLWPRSIRTGEDGVVHTLFRIPYFDFQDGASLDSQIAESVLGTIFCLAVGWKGSIHESASATAPLAISLTIENVRSQKMARVDRIEVVNVRRALSTFIPGGRMRKPKSNLRRAELWCPSRSLKAQLVRHVNKWVDVPIEEEDQLVSMEPLDPTVSPLYGSWEHPMSMAQALSVGTHALARVAGTLLLVPCDPFISNSAEK